MKTISDLEKKKWYRATKVIYVLFCIPFTTSMISEWLATVDIILMVSGIVVLFFVLQRVMYYIMLGTFLPKKR